MAHGGHTYILLVTQFHLNQLQNLYIDVIKHQEMQ